MGLGSEQSEKQTSKKLEARGKEGECRGVVMDQCLDSRIIDVQVVVLAGFSLPKKFAIGTLCIVDLQRFTGVLWWDARERGVSQIGGATFHHQMPFPILYVYIYVPITCL